MDTKRIREIVNQVNPPVKGKPMTLTKEFSSEIAKSTPFWAALLRKRDIRDADGGDEYVTALIETFSRIYAALKAEAAQGVLGSLDLDTLYSLDVELQKGELGLCDEYPALEMADVRNQGPFGAGTLMAYALFETALAVTDSPKGRSRRPEPAQTIGSVEEDPLSQAEALEPAQSLIDDLTAGLPDEPLTCNPPLDQTFEAPNHTVLGGEKPTQPPPTAGLGAWDWASGHAQTQQIPFMVLGLFQTKDGVVVRGDLVPTLAAAANAHNIVKSLFGAEANISMGPKGLEFSFAYDHAGGKS